MQPEVLTSYEDIAKLPANVKSLYKDFDIDIRSGSDLEKYLALCENLLDKIDSLSNAEHIGVHRAQRIFLAIVECGESLANTEERAALKSVLSQITANPLDPRTPGGSHALNMIFELDFLQYIKFRGLKGRLGEPDIVVLAPFGNYHIACKTINSFKQFNKNLRCGSRQIKKKGNGVIALNLEPHMCLEEPFIAQNVFEVRAALNCHLEGLYKKHKKLINKHLTTGSFDGVVIQISCIAAIASNPTSLDTVTQTIYYSRSNIQSENSYDRFNGFQQSMRGPMSGGFWFR